MFDETIIQLITNLKFSLNHLMTTNIQHVLTSFPHRYIFLIKSLFIYMLL